MFAYELIGCGFESRSVNETSNMAPALNKEFLDFWANYRVWIHSGTRTYDMIITCNVLKTSQYSDSMIESLFNKVAGLENNNFIKNTLQHRHLSVNIAKFLRLTISIFHWKLAFWANWSENSKIVCLKWNLAPRLIRICRI